MTLAEILVASALALVGILAALLLYQQARGVFKKGEQASDQQQETRVAYDRMVRNIRLAGYNWNASGEDRLGEEQIEGAFAAALTVRGDFDNEDGVLSRDPEDVIAGTTGKATVANDEIVTYCLIKPGFTGGSDLVFNADVTSSGSATSTRYGAVAPRDGVTETVTIPHVALTQTDPPYNLYQVTLNNAKSTYGTSDFIQYQLLAENIKSLSFTYLDSNGATVSAPGGDETATAKSARTSIRRVQVHVVGLTSLPDVNYTDPSDTGSTSHYRKFDLATDITPRNLGFVGSPDSDLTPPGIPTGFARCMGHCAGVYLSWNSNPPSDGVSQYRVAWGPTPTSLSNNQTVSANSLFLSGLTVGNTYYFAVRAEDSSGNASAYCSTISGVVADTSYPDHTVPAQVGSFAGTGGAGGGPARSGGIDLTWASVTTNDQPLACDPVGAGMRDMAGYRLYRSTTSPFTPGAGNRIASESILGSGATAYTDASVVNCRNYFYQLRAVDILACQNESPYPANPYQAVASSAIRIATPIGVTAARTGVTRANVTWTAVTKDTATPTPGTIFIDTYKVWRAQIPSASDPETAAYALIATLNDGSNSYVDNACPADTAGLSVYYKISATDDCPGNESAQSTAAFAACSFTGSVSMTPPSAPPGPNLDPSTKTVQVFVSGGTDAYTGSSLVITKSGGTQDLSSSQNSAGPSWFYSWTPSQSVGTYTAVGTVTNSNSCSRSTTNSWNVFISGCDTCTAIPPLNPDPSGGGSRYYRQQNTIQNSCAYDLQIKGVQIRARSICTGGCTSPMKLLKIQYITSGTFATELSNLVYTASGTGDNVSTTQTANITFATPLTLPATSTTAKIRFIFSTTTPIWVGTGAGKQSVLEAGFTYQQTTGLCSTVTTQGQQLD